MAARGGSTLRTKLCNICDACGGIYRWCEHIDVDTHSVPFEEARVVAAKHLLRIRFGELTPASFLVSRAHTDAYEVFGAPEEVT